MNKFGSGRGHQSGFSESQPELTASHVVGYRSWGPMSLEVPLTGMTIQEYDWVDGTNTATCFRHDEHHTGREELAELHGASAIPIRECGCGFWAYGDSEYSGYNIGRRISGVVYGWGKVIAGKNGFRSQYAMIVALCLPTEVQAPDCLERDIARMYPGVRLFEEWSLLRVEYAATDLAALVGDGDG